MNILLADAFSFFYRRALRQAQDGERRVSAEVSRKDAKIRKDAKASRISLRLCESWRLCVKSPTTLFNNNRINRMRQNSRRRCLPLHPHFKCNFLISCIHYHQCN